VYKRPVTRVLFVHVNTEWYGSDRSLVLLACALRDQGCEVRVALPGPGPLEDRLRGAGIDVHEVDVAPLRARVYGPARLVSYFLVDLPRAAVRLRALARTADVVHVNASIGLGGVVGGALARRPVVLHVRETYAGSEAVWRTYARIIRPAVTRVIAVSTGTLDEVAATALGDRATMIHNGLDFGPMRAPATDGPVVAVGRINAWKGHDVLLQAIGILHARGVDVPVEIAGDAYPGQEEVLDDLRDLAARLGITSLVRFLGYVEDVPALLRRTGIFVQPSKKPEPFGLSLVEAMAHGLPCVATDAGGPRDIVVDGATGLLVPPGDAAALAGAIERLWTDGALRARLGTAAATDVRRRFSIDATATQVLGVYREALDRTRAPRRPRWARWTPSWSRRRSARTGASTTSSPMTSGGSAPTSGPTSP
jgi:glycosyltransferase involved in cell wall biosynthesis